MSHGHEAQDGARGAVQAGLRDGVRKAMKEPEEGHCVPPTLLPSKGFTEERTSPGFGAARKRPLGPKAEEDAEMEGERVIHSEKRAKLCTGENFVNMTRHPRASPVTQIASRSALHPLSVHPQNSAHFVFPHRVLQSPVSSLVLFIKKKEKEKKIFPFLLSFLPSQSVPPHTRSITALALPPLSRSPSCVSLCVAASSEKCLILPLSGVQERNDEEGQPFSLSLPLSSFSSAVPSLCLPTLFKAALFFSFHLLSFSPSSVWVSFFCWHAVSRLFSSALADESNTRPL